MVDLSTIFGSKGKFKILKTLLEEEEINISSLLREARISYPLAIKYLSELEKNGLIKQKRFGRIRIISLENNRSTRILKNFLIEWKNSEEEKVGKGFG
ncbi:MAG: helix-turn-helix domain-containing protein [Nitrososphaeria archaeon]